MKNTKLNNKQKLELIDDILSMADYDEQDSKNDFINTIHKIAHPQRGCSHPDWEKESWDIYHKLKKEGHL